MNEEKKQSTGGALGFTGALQIAFIVLKLCHKINWAWGWVLAPTWMSAALVLIILIVFIILVK